MSGLPRSVSFVIPTMDEEETVRTLVEKITNVCDELALEFDILFVDDGSSDLTWPRIVALAEDYEQVRGIRFRRNFGKAAALSAGFAEATGDVVFTMDA
ncbi:MAG: glycosyltransferase, partial [Planctomycetota bacterium]